MEPNILSAAWPEWSIVKQLGGDSSGAVYEAVRRDNQGERHAAIQVISILRSESEGGSLRPEGLSQDAARTKPQDVVNDVVGEIQLMESFKGVQNIVGVEDYKVVERPDQTGWDIYIRMELLTPLDSYIRGTLSEQEVIKLGCDICTALECCARRNVIHRDIKPENIFVNPAGDFKLGGFGIARKLEDGGLLQKDASGYMAPEVERGTQYNATADLYSLGLILYRFMNQNRLPFLDTESQMLDPSVCAAAARRRMDGEPLPPPSGAPSALASIILCACAPDPNKRFRSATAMKNALMSLRSERRAPDIPDKPAPARRAPDADKPKKTGKLPKIIAAVLVLAALTAGGIFAVPRVMDIIGADHARDIDEDKNRDEDEIASILSRAEKLADENDFERALDRVQRGLEKYPDSKQLLAKADEYEAALRRQTEDAAPEYGTSVTVERLEDGSGYIRAVFTGISSQGEAVWTYETGTYPMAQLDVINDIGAYNGNYYLVENGSVCALSIADGSVRWVNREFGGSAYCSVFDQKGTLYLCGFLGPDLFIVDANGNTVKKIDSFDPEYVWPSQIVHQGSQVAITFEQTPSGKDEVVYVNLSDYSTSIANRPPAGETEPGIPKVSMSAVLNVTASSYLTEPNLGLVHGPANVTDGSLSNAWVENASGQGEGESITLQLDGIYTLSGFTINAGYQKSSSTYENNSRPAKLWVSFSDGMGLEVSLEDVNSQQKVTFPSAVETSSVTFIIESVYPGSKYEDTAISEIALF